MRRTRRSRRLSRTNQSRIRKKYRRNSKNRRRTQRMTKRRTHRRTHRRTMKKRISKNTRRVRRRQRTRNNKRRRVMPGGAPGGSGYDHYSWLSSKLPGYAAAKADTAQSMGAPPVLTQRPPVDSETLAERRDRLDIKRMQHQRELQGLPPYQFKSEDPVDPAPATTVSAPPQ